jgi:hypothetical protein
MRGKGSCVDDVVEGLDILVVVYGTEVRLKITITVFLCSADANIFLVPNLQRNDELKVRNTAVSEAISLDILTPKD